MTPTEARKLAHLWQGHPNTPLHTFASTGLVKDKTALLNEVQAAQRYAKPENRYALHSLSIFIDANVIKTSENSTWPHYAAPWSTL